MMDEKTLDDYMNDPEIADEPMYLREIHAIRFMIQDKTKNMTPEERTAYYNRRRTDNTQVPENAWVTVTEKS